MSWSGHISAPNGLAPSPISSEFSYRNRSLPPGLTRRTHKKSRAGCLTCKVRRIKCDEARPNCKNCLSKPSLQCRWSSSPPPSTMVVRAKPATQPSTVTKDFTLHDMKALHQFLVADQPHLPIGNLDIWMRNVPQLAHHHPCLMQAILGLGSLQVSELTQDKPAAIQGQQYRYQAIKGLNQLVAKSSTWTGSDADAALATFYALMFQTIHMPDSMDEYHVHVRGCAVITEHIRGNQYPTTFDLATDRAKTKLNPKIGPLLEACKYEDLINEAHHAFNELLSYLTDVDDTELCLAIKHIIDSFEKGLAYGITLNIDIYSLWYKLSGSYFKVFARRHSHTARILLTYLLNSQLVLHALLPWQWWPELVITMPPGQLVVDIIFWLKESMADIPDELQRYIAWPKSVIDRVPEQLTANVRPGIGSNLPQLRTKFLESMDTNAHLVMGDVLRLCTSLSAWFESILSTQIRINDVASVHGISVDSALYLQNNSGMAVSDEVRDQEMHRRIDMFSRRSDVGLVFPTAAVAGNFLQLNWSTPGSSSSESVREV